MTDRPWLRFDHREIAVIFSLFVFVSLLMFTVGIMVGKGLSAARYEGTLSLDKRLSVLAPAATPTQVREPNASGTSVTTPGTEIVAAAPAKPDSVDTETSSAPLVLVPQKPKPMDLAGSSLNEPTVALNDTDRVLNDPKLKGLIEEDPMAKRRALASSGRVPASFATGKFNVQVGSYPGQKDAAERVESLKKMGFSHAFFSAKELGDNKEVWFRVWLGYFPDYEAADSAGRVLVDRGEVKHYLVRKSDTPG